MNTAMRLFSLYAFMASTVTVLLFIYLMIWKWPV